MALSITKDTEVGINGYKYTIKNPIRSRYVERGLSRISTGDDSYAKEQFLDNWIIKDQS